MNGSISILELNKRLANAIDVAPDVHNVWVVGETSDLRQSRGHCYMELVEKDASGANLSRIRAIIWARDYALLSARFQKETNTALTSGLKIRALVSASYHPSFGMSVTISNIDASYTLGDAARRRAEILERLTTEGIIEQNRSLAWAMVPWRVAIVSARGAAGYGDFINHLLGGDTRLRFDVQLFEAVMQGERTAPTVLAALSEIARRRDEFDAVVIIRGGGSTTDLAAFDDYSIAAAVARFPLPVVVGIGHERDITVLDYVANQRVKTPTAAAELLAARVYRVYESLGRAAEKIYLAASQRIADNREGLARYSAILPEITGRTLLRASMALDSMTQTLAMNAERSLERAKTRLANAEQLLRVLSPDAILARGFSLTTLPDGSVLRDSADAPAGTTITTRLSQGTLTSTVN